MEIKGSMTYRGTIQQLEDTDLEIEIYDEDKIPDEKIGRKVVSLKGSLDSGLIKTDILVHRGSGKKVYSQPGHWSRVEGRVVLGNMPRFR